VHLVLLIFKSISYSDTAPATVGKNGRLYDHCAQMRHGKVT
jgi:hypothetical protein